MARRRQAAATVRRGRAVNVEATRRAADAFLSRFGNLADEVVALREALTEAQEENQQLRAELAEGIGLLRDATALVARAEPAKRGRRGRALRAAIAAAPPAAGPTRSRAATITASATGRPRRASANGRATPASVTADVVRAVIGKLGTATAGQIAAEIAATGTPVSGRAIRHIAKTAGAVARPGGEGRMVYSLT